jgi:glucose-1-phosphate adenylyltransferase
LALTSLLFSSVRVELNSAVEDCVVLPETEIGAGARIRRAILDKRCRIPPGTSIGYDTEADRQRFYVSPAGVVLVIPEMLGQRVHRAP